MSNKIEIYQKNTFNASIPIVDESGDSVDITNYSATFTLKKAVSYSSPIIQKLLSPNNNRFILSLSDEETDLDPAIYHYDIVLTNLGETEVKTVIQDVLEIKDSVKF